MNVKAQICRDCIATERTILATPGHYPFVTAPAADDEGEVHLQWGDSGTRLCTGYPDYFRTGIPNRAARRAYERDVHKRFPGVQLNRDGSPRDPRDLDDATSFRGPSGGGHRPPPSSAAPTQPGPGLFD